MYCCIPYVIVNLVNCLFYSLGSPKCIILVKTKLGFDQFPNTLSTFT